MKTWRGRRTGNKRTVDPGRGGGGGGGGGTRGPRVFRAVLHLAVIGQKSNYHNLMKIGPLPFLNEIITKGAFLSKARPPIYATVHAVMCKKH